MTIEHVVVSIAYDEYDDEWLACVRHDRYEVQGRLWWKRRVRTASETNLYFWPKGCGYWFTDEAAPKQVGLDLHSVLYVAASREKAKLYRKGSRKTP